MKVRYAAAADRDLILIYLASEEQFGRQQADAYVAGLRGAVSLIADYPLAARLRQETSPPVRARPFKSHLIIYTVDEAGVLVLRFRHGHEDWRSSPVGKETS